MEEQQLWAFFKKFSQNQHTEVEHQSFLDWLYTLPSTEIESVMKMYSEMASLDQQIHPQLAEKIESRLNELERPVIERAEPKKLWPLMLKIAVAACLVLIGAAYFYTSKVRIHQVNEFAANHSMKKIIHGGNRAILSLANGSTIVLDSVPVGKLANTQNIAVYKAKDGQIVFDASALANKNAVTEEIAYNTLSTPRGGQYFIKLTDGSKVWLNAGSSLKFPTAFSKTQRDVELNGEAYFEIAKDSSRPFRVKTATQSLQVLGTHFNVNAYSDENVVATTLLEGSVEISQLKTGRKQMLKPGQQARLGTDILVTNVDAEQFIDWKNGYFKFSRENIQSIMRKISRWYDVDVKYEGRITNEGFVGTIQRSKDISEVLKTLKLTGEINFKIEGKTITVSP